MNTISTLFTILFLFGSLNAFTQTTIILQPNAQDGKDAHITLNASNSNFGSSESLVIYTWTNSGNMGIMRSFLEFDLSLIPENANVINASLSLYYNSTDANQSFDYHTGDNEAYILRIIEPWDESLITWNNQPNTTSMNLIELAASTSLTQDYLDIDVTNLIVDMLYEAEGNNGFMIRMQNEIDPYRSLLFASSDHSNSAVRPKLEVTYLNNDSDSCYVLKPGSEGKDAAITLNDSDSNYGNSESLVVYTWTNSGNLGIMRSFLEFDLSFLPENAVLSSSSLSLFYNPTNNTQSFDFHSGENEAFIQRVTESWEENTINWNNQPTTTEINQVELPASESGSQNYLNIDVTNLVTDMVNPDLANYGFVIKMQNEIDPYKSLLFASSDHINNDLHPELEVCWYTFNAVDNIVSENYISIYPNPSQGTFTLFLVEERIKSYYYEIINLSGQTILTGQGNGQEHQLDLSDQKKGIYIIRIFLDDDVIMTKRLFLQ